jgi:hypothetical protein
VGGVPRLDLTEAPQLRQAGTAHSEVRPQLPRTLAGSRRRSIDPRTVRPDAGADRLVVEHRRFLPSI